MATETTTDTTLSGGFAGDPAEAFNPPAAGSCCGSAPAAQAAAETAGCCGTDTAVAAGSCCGSAPASESVAEPATGGGCCG